MIDIKDFYSPAFVGNVSSNGNAACFGWVAGHESELVALSVMAGTTTIESIYANVLMGSSIYLYRDENDIGPYWSSKYGYAGNHLFTKYQSVVPNSSYVSLILINKSLEGYVPTTKYLYLPNVSDLEERFFRRLKQICLLPVLREWVPYLMKKGRGHEGPTTFTSYSVKRLCGDMSQNIDSWMAKSFNVFWMLNSRSDWEEVITRGLKLGEISIHSNSKEAK